MHALLDSIQQTHSKTTLPIAMRRLIHQRLVQPTFTTPAEVVRWMGAVQAQEFLSSLWAIGTRLQHTTEQAVTEQTIEQAITERTIARTWPMRGTVHFVPAEDAHWMVQLMAPRVMSRYQSIYRQLGLDQEILARSRKIIVRALEGGKQLSRPVLYELLEAEGIATGHMRGLHIIGQLAQEALICFGSRQGKQPTFALLDDYAPAKRTPSRDEAIAEMALRYFRSHGPATLQDFVWWTGLLVSEARAGVESIKSLLIAETIAGKSYFWAEAPYGAPTAPSVYLLPAFDEYLVSYKDRSPSFEPHNQWLWAPERHLSSTLVIDGLVVGLWKRTFKKNAVVIDVTSGRAIDDAERQGIEAAAQRYAEFVDLPLQSIGIEVMATL